MIKVDLHCDIASPSGYSAHARELVKAMDPVCDLRIIDHKHDKDSVSVKAEEAKLIKDLMAKDRKPDVRIQFETPEFFKPEAGVVNIGFTQWETSRIPDTENIPGTERTEARFNWVAQMNKMDVMWTSCDYARCAFMESGVTVPIERVQGPVDTEFYQPRTEEMPLEDLVVMNDLPVPRNERPVCLGMIAQWTPRKGVDDFLVCALSRFDRDEVTILLKTYGGDFSDREQAACVQEVKKLRKMVRNPRAPRIVLITHKLTDMDISRLYNTMDIYVNPSKGEGLCMPLVQAMASEVVPVSNRFSAPSDYIVDQHNGFSVNYTLEPAVYQPYSPWYRYDQDWGRIDVKDLENNIRAAISVKHNEPRAWARMKQCARKTIVDNMSTTVVGKHINKLLEEAIGSPRRSVAVA